MPTIKSVGTGEEASCQENHTPTSMDDWATQVCVKIENKMRHMSQHAENCERHVCSSEVSILNRKIEKLTDLYPDVLQLQ